MRISDRSSDVCYSDLPSPISSKASENARIQHSHPKPSSNITRKDRITTPCPRDSTLVAGITHRRAPLRGHGPPEQITLSFALRAARSEEHTSELQSLMRNSYAVFCLKKQKKSLYQIH